MHHQFLGHCERKKVQKGSAAQTDDPKNNKETPISSLSVETSSVKQRFLCIYNIYKEEKEKEKSCALFHFSHFLINLQRQYNFFVVYLTFFFGFWVSNLFVLNDPEVGLV